MRILTFTLLLLALSSCVTTNYASVTSVRHVVLPDARMSIYFESSFTAAEKTKLVQWLKVSAQAINTLYGEFPVKQVNVHLYSKPQANEPVPWGEVWKNGEYKVNFQVNPRYSLNAFIADWTAPHELSHLLHPYPGHGNSWFGEGLASYYQNILRVRQHSLDEVQAWQKLYEGFRRGEKQAERTRMTLQNASRTMRSTGSFMHVYWGGAAYFMKVDIRLRQVSNGQESLDTAWFKFKQCCLFGGDWPVEKLLRKLDQLTKTTVFIEEYHHMMKARSFPDYSASLKQLGITIKGNKVQLSSKKSKASALRRTVVTTNTATNTLRNP